MDDDKHYPPGSDAEKAAAEEAAKAQAEAEAKAQADVEAKAKEEADAKAKEDPEAVAVTEAEAKAKAEAEAKAKAEQDAADKIKKPRSIYDDYKEKKDEAKTEKARADAAEAKALELQALLDKKDEAETPAEKKEAAKDLKEYAEKHKLDPDGLEELRDIILKDIPKPEMPEGLSKDEIEAWRKDRASSQRDAEDRAIEAQSPAIRDQLKQLGFEIHDDAEATKVMAEVKKLAHTAKYHDKEVDYIVFTERTALSKLISPKKSSFEAGSGNNAEAGDEKVDFGSGKVTPAQAQKAMEHPKSGYEVRRAQ